MGILGALGSNPSSLPLGQPVAPPVAAPVGMPAPAWASGPTADQMKAREAEMRRVRMAGLSQLFGSLAVGQAPDVSASAKALAEMRERGQATLGNSRTNGQQTWQMAQMLGLSPEQMRVLAMMPEQAATEVILGLAGAKFQPPERVAPLTDLGKLQADLRAGLITQEQYDAAVAQATGGDPMSAIAKLNADLAAGRITPEQHKAAIESTLSKNGLSIEVGPDGNVRVVQGDIGKDPTDATNPSTPAAMLATIDGILNDPALDWSVGWGQFLTKLPGTQAARVGARLSQLEGQAFLRAFESLKGGGQITETEGKKATEALTRLSRDLSPQDYRAALAELKSILQGAIARQTLQERGGEVPNPYSGMSDEELLKIIQGAE